eukprot:11223318-Lingulodinium_polyedra.AAC.1
MCLQPFPGRSHPCELSPQWHALRNPRTRTSHPAAHAHQEMAQPPIFIQSVDWRRRQRRTVWAGQES